ncbi:HlyD family type I secretion periplasmic adaptor subunit [Mesorhizobium sp. B2-4-14]|uniref:HlyD family type I secretion periplasmic adaptor subunit n=1 Tax=Mesorhizobium sp. B2-4-14 TaxID=2589935 RepID=UPI0011261599|nr:HlyD family type I secretion periplasmic adaptor subunit [Mesorhizobium sp. B2-4-14]TPK96479.1 HlyD family type I secretion periplasmic adaptor subunit [Mesorhizobium sp. B2-4-14]
MVARNPAYAGPCRDEEGIRANLAGMLLGIGMLAAVIAGWAATVPLAAAVIASGTVVVDSSVKKIQHPTGGVVGEIHVRDGDRVQAGDLLIRLDETVARANLEVVAKQLDEIAGRTARLKAEQSGNPEIVFPAELAARRGEPDIAEILAGEQAFFQSRRDARDGQKAQLDERIDQLRIEIGGLEAQQAATETESGLIRKELDGVQDLFKKNLVPIDRLTNLERDSARVEGESGHLTAAAAQARGKIAETRLQITQIDQDLRTDANKDLRETLAKQAELVERRIAAEDQLRRIDIRSPETGIVHQLSVHTVGGVINAGEQIMLIVPERDALVVEARIAPQDIDKVEVGEKAAIRFSAFNVRTTPEINGEVSFVAADLTKESQTQQAFYAVRARFSTGELERAGGLRLVPGMPAEVHIATAERTALSYLMKPFRDQLAKAFNEQ